MVAQNSASRRTAFRPLSVALLLLAYLFTAQVQAQYVAPGWQPGQPRDAGVADAAAADAALYGPEYGWRPGGGRAGAAAKPKDSGSFFKARGSEGAPGESTFDSLVRSGLKKVFKYSDEDVNTARAYSQGKKNPKFHPRVEVLSRTQEDLPTVLGFGPPGVDEDESVFAEMKRVVSDALPEAVGGYRTEPWAILVSASRQDKESQNQDVVFNRTIHALFPDASLGLPQIIQPPGPDDDLLADDDEDEGGAIASDEYEEIGGFLVPKEKSAEQKAADAAAAKARKKARAAAKKRAEEVEQLEGVEVLSASQAAKREKLANMVRPELEKWRFGYMDFFNNTHDIAWSWDLWKVPVLVIATPSTSTSRTYDLRFWKVAFAKPHPNDYLAFLGDKGQWQALKVWDSSFAPGGKRHHWVLRVAGFFKRWIDPIFEVIPGWILTLGFGAMASMLPTLLHSEDDKKLKAAHEAKKARKYAQQEALQRGNAAMAAVTSNGNGKASAADVPPPTPPKDAPRAPDTPAAGTRSRSKRGRK